jgi:hypothetical protein
MEFVYKKKFKKYIRKWKCKKNKVKGWEGKK